MALCPSPLATPDSETVMERAGSVFGEKKGIFTFQARHSDGGRVLSYVLMSEGLISYRERTKGGGRQKGVSVYVLYGEGAAVGRPPTRIRPHSGSSAGGSS